MPGDDTGTTYAQGISASGGTGTYTWSVTSGSLPPGLSLNTGTGEVTGDPTTAGSYTFTVGLTDSGGGSTSQQYTVVIASPPDITTSSLPGGDVYQAYNKSIVATGGTAPLTWAVLSGDLPPGLLLNTGTGALSGTPTTAGAYTFTVEATDQVGQTTTHAYTVTIANPVSIATTSLPGDDVGVTYGPYALSASNGTGPYAWSVSSGTLPPGLSLDPSTGALAGTPTAAGSYTFTAEVTDAAGQTATQQYTVDIASAPSVAPATLAGGEVNVAYIQTLTATAGTGPYTWSVSAGSLPPGLSIDQSTGALTGTPTISGTYTFTASVLDADGQSASQAYSVTVQAPPSVTTPSIGNGEVNVAYIQTLTATAGTGPYTWSIGGGTLPAGVSLDPTTGAVSGTPTVAGNFSVTAVVTDSLGQTNNRQYSFTVLPDPSVTTPSLPGTEVGAAYDQTVAATGGTGPYTWSLASGSLPPGLILDPASGTVSGAPSASGNYSFTLRVTDKDQQSAITPSYTVDVISGPSIAPGTLPGGELGVAYSQTLKGSGGKGPYSWSLDDNSALPLGLSLDPATGVISGTPTTAEAVGDDDFTVDLTDANGVEVKRSYVVTIAADPAMTTGTTLPGGQVGSSYDEALAVSGGTVPYTWSLAPGSQLPPGLGLGAASGTVTGSPSIPGTYSFAVTVTDALGQSNSRTFTLTVTLVPTTQPPLSPAGSALTITTPTDPGSGPDSGGSGSNGLEGGQIGAGYSATLDVAGGAGPYSWSLASGNLPPGLTLDPSTGTINGMPTVRGTYTFTVTVTDAQGRSFSETMTILVGGDNKDLPGPTVSEKATVGPSYAGNLPKPSGGKAPYEWTVASGVLPPGLRLNPKTGAVTGTAKTPGSYTFTVKVVDADGQVYLEAVTLTVAAPGLGYRLVGSDGGVFDFKAPFRGSCELDGSRCQKLDRHVDAMASTPDGRGYWLVARDGGVFAFGDARFYGSCRTSAHSCGVLTSPVVAVAPTPDGNGYWLATTGGAVYGFGDAAGYGSCASPKHPCGRLTSQVVGIAASPAGGYWLATAKGDVFGFGQGAPDLGTCVAKSSRCDDLDAKVVGIASAPSGSGYWLVAADGGVFAFGSAHFYGNTRTAQVENQLVGRVVGMTTTPDGSGYWLVAADGGVFAFGEARFYGNTRTAHVEHRLVGQVMGIAYSSGP